VTSVPDIGTLASLRREVAFALDTGGIVRWADPATLALLETSIGAPLADSAPPAAVNDLERLIAAAFAGPVQGWLQQLTIDGSSQTVSFSAAAIDDGVLLVGAIVDERAHRLDEEHRRRADELAELDRRKDEFLGMLAHELRNPLNAIAAANSLMDRVGAQDARNTRLRNTIRRQTRHLARLVDDLLEVSRVTRGKMRLQTEPTDLVVVLRSAIDNTRPLIDGRNQHLEVTLPAERLCMTADSLRLEQVFVNLLQNASKYSEPGSTIYVECAGHASGDAGRDRAIVRVRDQGVGIPESQLTAIFDLFVQVDQSLARSLGGLGLGLTISRSLVQLHGGTITARSEGRGRGAEFIVELPLEEVQPLVQALGPDATADLLGQVPASLVVLVVEDNRDAREMLQAWLQDLGHRVHSACDGIEALALARTVRPDVALIDIGLPGLDGYQVAENLRASADGERTLLVAITGYGRPEDSARAREAGFDAHLVKPVQPEMLARLIRSAGKVAAASPAPIRPH
jgi:signal transduction histidine kinase/CheY-like chemotaxis protein